MVWLHLEELEINHSIMSLRVCEIKHAQKLIIILFSSVNDISVVKLSPAVRRHSKARIWKIFLKDLHKTLK